MYMYSIIIVELSHCALSEHNREWLVVSIIFIQNTTMSELRTRVEELKMENDYQLRLKDMNYNEKIKDLSDKFIQEIESLKANNEVHTVLLF